MPTTAWPQKCHPLEEEPLTDEENLVTKFHVPQGRRQAIFKVKLKDHLQIQSNLSIPLLCTCIHIIIQNEYNGELKGKRSLKFVAT